MATVKSNGEVVPAKWPGLVMLAAVLALVSLVVVPGWPGQAAAGVDARLWAWAGVPAVSSPKPAAAPCECGPGLTCICGGTITTGTVTTADLAANTITTSTIAAGMLTAGTIASDTIISGTNSSGLLIGNGGLVFSGGVMTVSGTLTTPGTVTIGSMPDVRPGCVMKMVGKIMVCQ